MHHKLLDVRINMRWKGKKRKENPVTSEPTEVGGNERKFDESLFEDYDSESKHSNQHHRHHHTSPRPPLYQPVNLTTAQPGYADPALEVTLDYLDFNFTEGPSTESSLYFTSSKFTPPTRVKLPKPTPTSENKVCTIGRWLAIVIQASKSWTEITDQT